MAQIRIFVIDGIVMDVYSTDAQNKIQIIYFDTAKFPQSQLDKLYQETEKNPAMKAIQAEILPKD